MSEVSEAGDKEYSFEYGAEGVEYIHIGSHHIRVDREVNKMITRNKKNVELASGIVCEPADHEEYDDEKLFIFAGGPSKIAHEALIQAAEEWDIVDSELDPHAEVYGGLTVNIITRRYDHDSIDYGPPKIGTLDENERMKVALTDFLLQEFN